MASGIYVSPEVMDEQGRKTVEYANQLHDQIEQLQRNKEGLLDIWKGLSATNFGASVDSQVSNLNEFEALINLLGEKISSGANTLNDTEEQNAQEGRNLFEQ